MDSTPGAGAKGQQYNSYWMLTDIDTGNARQGKWVSAFYLRRWGNDAAPSPVSSIEARWSQG